jgi:hypothetical protein
VWGLAFFHACHILGIEFFSTKKGEPMWYVRMNQGGQIEFREHGISEINMWKDSCNDLRIGDIVSLFRYKGGIEGDAVLVGIRPPEKIESWYNHLRKVLVFKRVKK